jgi:hypothetical protein
MRCYDSWHALRGIAAEQGRCCEGFVSRRRDARGREIRQKEADKMRDERNLQKYAIPSCRAIRGTC